jgi:hypothetical protein
MQRKNRHLLVILDCRKREGRLAYRLDQLVVRDVPQCLSLKMGEFWGYCEASVREIPRNKDLKDLGSICSLRVTQHRGK